MRRQKHEVNGVFYGTCNRWLDKEETERTIGMGIIPILMVVERADTKGEYKYQNQE